MTDRRIATVHIDPPSGVDWHLWSTQMKNNYKDRTGRTLSFRFRQNRSDIKQLSFHGPLDELDVALEDAQAMIQALPADAVAEPAGSPRGKSLGKGGKGKSGKGKKENPPLVPAPQLHPPPWFLAQPPWSPWYWQPYVQPGLHADPVDTRDRSPQVAARDRSPQVAARDRSPQVAARDRSTQVFRDRSPSQSSSANDSTQHTRSASPSADVGASCSAAQPPRSSTTPKLQATAKVVPAKHMPKPPLTEQKRVRFRSPSLDKQRL
jgi:hypothetical protein